MKSQTFENQVVIVTGASGGIGKACAEAFARQGARVALAARRLEKLKAIVQDLKKQGLKAEAFACDVRDEKQIQKLAADVKKIFGDCSILVNNAGIGVVSPLEKMKIQEIDDMLNTNLRGLILLTREVLPSMIKRKTGVVVNISSVAGKIGISEMAVYSASKFAVNGFSSALLEEVRGNNIKVVSISPGMVDTEIHKGQYSEKRKDMIQPEEVAEACLLAASPSETSTVSEIVIRPRRPI